jgi:HK97 family phage portal protein
MIHGEAWVEKVGVGGGARIQEFWLHNPERMAPVPGPFGIAQAYEERAKNGETIRWDVNPTTGESDILFTRTPNPADAWRGAAPTYSAAAALDANNDGAAMNAALLQNSATPSGVLTFKDELTNDQRQRLKDRLDLEYSGPKNSGRPMVIEGEMNWQQLGMTPADMLWIESNRETARHIALAYGVPPILLGIPGDATYSNLREANLAFYDDTILPLAHLFADEFSRFTNLQIKVNTDEIEALDYRRERRWDRVQTAEFLTIDEKREALGYDPLGPARGGDIVIAVEKYGALGFDFDESPDAAGRRAFGSSEGG